MAVTKMRKMGQDDSEEQKPLDKAKDVASMAGNVARTFFMEPSDPSQRVDYGEGPTPTPKTPEPPNAWYQSYGRYAPPKMMPMYDDGGPVDPNALPPQAFDPNTANAVGQSAVDSAAQATPESGMHKAEDAVRRAGAAMDDPSTMPGQSANTRMYPIQGLEPKAPIYDDGGLVKKIGQVGSKVVAPDDDSAQGIAEKNRNIEEYNAAYTPKQEEHTEEAAPAKEVDKVNPNAKYGDRPGEKRIDVSDFLKPIGSPKMAPIYDDGGPVKNDPNDGHHQVAVLEEGERVLTPEQNAAYEQEHGAPAGFSGRVMQQPNPPVKPMMDTEHPPMDPITSGSRGDVAQPDGKGGASPVPTEASAEQASMMQPVSNKVSPTMAASPKVPAPNAEAGATGTESGSAPKMQPVAGEAGATGAPAQPEHNSMATTTSAHPLPNERQKLEAERASLKQKMVDAAEGKFNNGKFDHIAYGEAKMALADLNKAHPWGQPGNHEGMLGKIGHGLAVAGELASDSVMGPGFTAAIPGTRENLMQQEAQGQQQITQGLAGKASQAETGLKEAQAGMAGRPKDPKQGIAFETFNLNHTAPGTPEHQRAQENLAEYQKQNDELEKAKLGGKREKLPEQISAQTAKVLSLPEGSPERAQAESDLAFMQKQAQMGQKLTDRRREIIDHATAMGLDPNDPAQYDKAMRDYESNKSGARAEGSLPVWKNKAAIQNSYATQRALLVQQNADANQFALHGATAQLKADQSHNDAISQFQSIKNILATADESTVASNVIPMLTTLGMISTEGKVKRLNPQELNALSPAQGSMYRWVAAHADRLAAGQLPDGYKTEVGNLLDQMIKEQDEVWKTNTQAIDKNFGEHGQTPEVKNNPKGGTTVTPKKATPNTPTARPNGVPAGATHVYKDKAGNVVGYAQGGQYHALKQ